MKRIIVILMVLVMCFSLSNCGNSEDSNANAEPKTWQEDARTEEMKDYAKYFRFFSGWDVAWDYMEKNDLPKDTHLSYTGEYKEYFENHYRVDTSLDSLINEFNGIKETHLFAQKFLEEINKTNYFELDAQGKIFFECYMKMLFMDNDNNFYVDNTQQNFNLKGLDAGLINSLENGYIKENEDGSVNFNVNFSNHYIVVYYDEEGYKTKGVYMNSNKKPEWKTADVLDIEIVKNVIVPNLSFFEFVAVYRDQVYAEIRDAEFYNAYSADPDAFAAVDYDLTDDEAKDAPAIGMKKKAVENSSWGEPDRINVNEYEWGIHEQWVYEDKGYIYFEDGRVTSISYSY